MSLNERQSLDIPQAPWIKSASYIRRVGSFGVNILVPEMVLGHLGSLGDLLMVAWVAFNSVWMRGKTGRSLGEVLMNTRVARIYESDFGTETYLIEMTPARALTRTLCRIFDFLPLGYGIIRPLRHHLGQTFSDEMTHTMVIKDHPLHAIFTWDQVMSEEGRR